MPDGNLAESNEEKNPKDSKRSRRKIKKAKKESSISELEESPEESSNQPLDDNFIDQESVQNSDIVMEGNLIYRHELDQIEFEGNWCMCNDATKESFSYLLLKDKQSIICPVKMNQIDFSGIESNGEYLKKYLSTPRQEYYLHICAANIYECLFLPHNVIFNTVLSFLSGEYHGYFLYYNKTIEDRFLLNFSLEDNQVRINGKEYFKVGEGTNSLGNFNIIGYINFYTSKGNIKY